MNNQTDSFVYQKDICDRTPVTFLLDNTFFKSE